jgi:hypothetical protein
MGRSNDRQGVSRTGAASVAAVVAVLILVSLPRLHAFALEENETDAASLTRQLIQALAGVESEQPTLLELVGALGMEARTDDLEWIADGRILRRHGYLFELSGGASRASLSLRAWPWTYGETGRAAFQGTANGAVRRHPNPGGDWSGPEFPPRLAAGGWLDLSTVEFASW